MARLLLLPALTLGLIACGEDPTTTLDASAGSDAGGSNDSGFVPSDGGVGDAVVLFDAGLGNDAGVENDAGVSNDAGPAGDAGYAFCSANHTGMMGALLGTPVEYSTSVARSGVGSARSGDLALGRWFNGGVLYTSSERPLDATAQSVSSILRLPDDGPSPGNFYCAQNGTAQFLEPTPSDFRLQAELDQLIGIGSCPGGTATTDTLDLCVSNPALRACTSSAGTSLTNLLSGTLEGSSFEQPAGVIAIRVDTTSDRVDALFASGRGLARVAPDAGGSNFVGYLIWRGPNPLDAPTVYCVNQATRSGALPDVVISFQSLSRLARCAEVSAVSGTLSLCSE